MKINPTAVFFSLSMILHLLLLGVGLTWKPRHQLSFNDSRSLSNMGARRAAESPLPTVINSYLIKSSETTTVTNTMVRAKVLPSASQTPKTIYSLPRLKQKSRAAKKTITSPNKTTDNTIQLDPTSKTQHDNSATELLRLLYVAIAKQQRYPQGFQEKSISVRVAFRVHPGGKITHIVLDKSSQHDNFDSAALQAVTAASPVYALVGKLHQPTYFRIEIIFANT